MNKYREAPTWLYNKEGESKLFRTQVEVDQAWREGWFGPPWGYTDKPPLSKVEAKTKAGLKAMVEDDPRYVGITLNTKRSTEELQEKLREYEIEKGILLEGGPVEDEDEED